MKNKEITYSDEVVGVDLGGTWIRGALIKDKRIEKVEQSPTVDSADANRVIDDIIRVIEKVITPRVQAIGIGVPGVLNRETGVVYDVANIPSWKEVGIRDILQQQFNVPVFVDNDANCFALGERVYGCGVDDKNFVGLTLGTGIGAGIIQNGGLMMDANCGSGEFCIVPYRDSDYEQYCSSFFFKKHNVKGKEIFTLAQNGDENALKLFDELGFHIANLVKLVVSTIDPSMIVFGGSISRAFPFFSPAMYREMKNYAYPNSMNKLKVCVSELKESALLGAAALCYKRQ